MQISYYKYIRLHVACRQLQTVSVALVVCGLFLISFLLSGSLHSMFTDNILISKSVVLRLSILRWSRWVKKSTSWTYYHSLLVNNYHLRQLNLLKLRGGSTPVSTVSLILVIVDTTAAPCLYIVVQQYSCSLCGSLKYTDS